MFQDSNWNENCEGQNDVGGDESACLNSEDNEEDINDKCVESDNAMDRISIALLNENEGQDQDDVCITCVYFS